MNLSKSKFNSIQCFTMKHTLTEWPRGENLSIFFLAKKKHREKKQDLSKSFMSVNQIRKIFFLFSSSNIFLESVII